MLNTVTLLLLYQLLGEFLVRATNLPIPGPVIGMLFLLITLLKRRKVSDTTRQGTASILQHLSLMFVPAGAGVMLHLQRVGSELLPIVVSLIVSTYIGLAVTVLVLKLMTKKSAAKEESV